MAFKCTVPGCEDSEKEFKTETALKSHIRSAHPEYKPGGGGDEGVEYTDIQDQFLILLNKYSIKKPETIVDYVSTQGERILEDPEKLTDALTDCDISPVRRRQIIKHWFAEKGIEVPEETLTRAALPPEERGKDKEALKKAEEDRKSKYSVDTKTGAITVATDKDKALTMEEAEKLSELTKGELEEKRKGAGVKYVYDSVDKVVRMAKEGEQGGTIDEAKELKKMAEEVKHEETESPFIKGEDGNWTLNPKARVTGIELLALEALNKSHERGEPLDPLDAITQAKQKMSLYKEVWGGGGNTPEWMSDPVKFIQAIRTISGGDKGDDAVTKQIADLRQTLDEMKDLRNKEAITSLQAQIQALAGKQDELLSVIADLKRTPVGRTDMDILHEVIQEGVSVVKSELPGLRGDIRSVFSGGGLPAPKTPEQRQQRLQQYKQALKEDAELEELGNKLFLTPNP